MNTIHPIIQSYISARVKGSSRNKGKRLLSMGGCTLNSIDFKREKAIYKVESEYYYNQDYEVVIKDFNNKKKISSQCNCPYDWGGMCKHEVAALLALEQRLATAEYQKRAKPIDNKIFMKYIEENKLKDYINQSDWTKGKQLARAKRATIEMDENQTVKAILKYKHEVYRIAITKVSAEVFQSTCTCAEQKMPLCLHRLAVFLQLSFEHGKKAFEMMKNWDEDKNRLLEPYGFSLDDDINGKFDFKVNNYDKLSLIVLDSSLLKAADLKAFGKQYAKKPPSEKTILLPASAEIGKKKKKSSGRGGAKIEKYGMAYVFDFYQNNQYLPFFEFIPIIGKLNAEETQIVSHITPLSGNYGYGQIDMSKVPIIDEKDIRLIQLAKEIKWQRIGQYVQQLTKVKLNYTWENGGGYFLSEKDLSVDAFAKVYTHLGNKFKELFDLLKEKSNYLLKEESKTMSMRTLLPLKLSQEDAKLQFELYEKDGFIELNAQLNIKDRVQSINKTLLINKKMLLNDNELFLLDSHNEPEVLKIFTDTPTVKIKKEALPTLLSNVVLPLQNKYYFDTDIPIHIEELEVAGIRQIFLKESEEYLIIQPLVTYGSHQAELDGADKIVSEKDNKVVQITRDKTLEGEFEAFMTMIHPDFGEQKTETDGLYYYISYDDIMEKAWFLEFFDTLKKEKIEVFGFKELHKFRYDVNKPTIDFKVSSGIDWFDIKANVQYGDQNVSLRDVQKALVRKERFVRLNNGKLGILPEKWLQQYATLFKMGNIKGDTLKVSKVHFSLVDELYDQLDEEDILRELKEKKEKLKNFSAIQKVKMPKNVNATLRNYQKEGFNWFNFLDEFQWGGCLADDMGLGKTVQVLTFLQHLKEKRGKTTHLIIVPTSLIFNWIAETDKFCTDLTILKHHGLTRVRHKTDEFNNYDIILTSYGTMASDIELLSSFHFDYIVLDESQSIKNPTTKRYKAARLLNANNRLALTGTPIENNTFDLYAQFNFLNPGILGSRDFFKNEFANPIDKNGNQERVDELKKIIYPFLLRRTKEMVAEDLPPKTETVLYCEMLPRQRRVYEAFRDNYKAKILEKISEEGMNRAGMYILEGLMKLRQICDSPALLKDPEDYGKDSIKLQELSKHITEKTGNHKVLVFSQFLGMLAMVRDALEHHKIKYAYLDGSISPKNRQKAIKHFQEEKSCRVFLISLKAGGFGLNLTAADYVYLLDPWWNPAVEQQAIDRVHRIGQKNNVFAYKMICKGTVEEKILELQNKKKSLANDIISAEKSFLKTLDKNDVEYLFS